MKKALSIILVLAMMLSTFALLPVSAEEAAAPVAPNLYEVEGVQTITVPKQTETAPKADGVLTEGEYTTVQTFTKDSAGIGVMSADEKFFSVDDVKIGYVKMAISHDDNAIYFGIVVQQDDFKYGASGLSLQVLADDDGDSISATKQFETTLKIDGSAEAPVFFAGTSNFTITNEATGATKKEWTYLNTVHGEKNSPTPANAKYRYFTRGVDAEGKAITTYEIKYTMSDMKKFFGADNDFSRITIKMNAWAFNERGQTVGRWTYWNAPNDELKAKLEAAYGFAPGTYGNVVVLKNPKLNNLGKLLGQETYTVYESDNAPVADGVVGAKEYQVTYTIDKNNPNYYVNAGEDKFGYINMSLSEDADNIYVAFVIQVDNYTGVSNDQFLVQMGFNQTGAPTATKQYFQTCMWLETAKSNNFKLNTSLEGGGSQWGYLNTLHGDKGGNNDLVNATGVQDETDTAKYSGGVHKATSRYFAKGTDAEGKAIVVFEYKYIKSVVKTAFGIDDINQAYIRIVAKTTNADNSLAGEIYYPNTLAKMTGDQKVKADAFVSDLKAAYGDSTAAPGWVGNVIKFNAPPTVSPATADNSNTTVYVLVGVVAIVALVSVGTVLVVDKKRRAAKIEK